MRLEIIGIEEEEEIVELEELQGDGGVAGGEVEGGEAAVPGNRPQDVAGVEGERVSLEDWLDPVVPGPHPGPVEEDAIGWNRIDAFGVWDCMLCPFQAL